MKKQSFIIIFSILIFTLLSNLNSTSGQINQSVFIVTSGENEFSRRIGLDSQYVIDIHNSVPSTLNSSNIIIILDYELSDEEVSWLQTYSGGVILVLGEDTSQNITSLVTLGLATNTNSEIVALDTLPLPNPDAEHDILTNIQWNSVPTIQNYTNINHQGESLIEADGSTLISLNNNFLLCSIWLEDELNLEFVQWPYFNYMLYVSIQSLTQQTPVSYAEWPYSPVPHTNDSMFIGIIVVITALVTIGGFLYARKYSKKNVITDTDLQKMKEEETEEKKDDEWEEIGMHRPLGGFLIQLFIGIAIVLPNVIMSALVFPLLILPSPQAAGFYDFTLRFFEALWLLFDLGTRAAAIKFFSAHRVKNPQKAIKYFQIFVWYQMISGFLQLFLISFLGSMIFPQTFLAHMSWIFVTHAFFQWPAFFTVFMILFLGMNRIDYYQIVNLLLYAILNISLQYAVIVMFRMWLGPNLIFGDSLAGAIGYSVGNYVIQWTAFFISLYMFKKLGFKATTVFRVDFTLEDVIETFKFGVKWAVGKILPPLGWFFQVFLLSLYLPNYTEQQGFFSLAWGFALIVMLVGLFAEGLLSGVSESFHHGRKKLTQYYAVSSLKWGAFFDLFFVGALMTIGPRFILGGAGAEWAGAAIIIPWLLIFHAIGYLSWLADWMFAGSDRPGWAAVSWVLEQALRTFFLFLLIPQWQWFDDVFGSPMIAVMFAYVPALLIKDIFAWWAIRKSDYFTFPWKDLYWQGIITPIISGVAIFIILEIINSIIWQGEIVTSVLILLIGITVGLYLYSFIYGLVGGFDDKTLEEFEKSANMAHGVRPFARGLYKASALGARFSPLHNKFPITIFDKAKAEADSLTAEKTELVL